MGKRVLLGMSGGVDSSVSALLLKKEGYEVIGITMILCNNNFEKAVNDAKLVCDKLGIKHFICDYRNEFKTYVINNFIDEYKNARTPNPCVECNRYLKFGVLYEKAKELNCDYIATGHYAKTEFSQKYNRYVLKKSESEKKDQTYFLYNVDKEVIEHIIFPLQNFTDKMQIRTIAEENELFVAKKKDSQEICFVPDNDYVGFLKKEIKNIKCGRIILRDGTVLGENKGLINYTIGQRKGLGISYKEPLYVIKLDKKKNDVIVSTEKELYSNTVIAENINLQAIDKIDKPISVMAKIRYRTKQAQATIYPIKNGKLRIEFETPQKAITPGQSIVFYDDDILIGGGKIGEEI